MYVVVTLLLQHTTSTSMATLTLYLLCIEIKLFAHQMATRHETTCSFVIVVNYAGLFIYFVDVCVCNVYVVALYVFVAACGHVLIEIEQKLNIFAKVVK